jgi:hypothetical protein
MYENLIVECFRGSFVLLEKCEILCIVMNKNLFDWKICIAFYCIILAGKREIMYIVASGRLFSCFQVVAVY